MATCSSPRASSALRTYYETIHWAHRYSVPVACCRHFSGHRFWSPLMVKMHIPTWSSKKVNVTSCLFCAAVDGVRKQLQQQNWQKWLSFFTACVYLAVRYSESCRYLTVDCPKDQMTSYLKHPRCPLLSKATVLSMVAYVGLDQHVEKTLHFLLFLSKRLIHTPRSPFPLYFTVCTCADSK